MSSKFSLPISLATLFIFSLISSLHAVAPAQIDDFQDGTTQGWSSSNPDPSPPVNQPNTGPGGIGDNALYIEAAPFESIAIENTSQWAGDYLAAGIDELLFDFENPGSTSFSLGATLSGPGGSVITLSTQSIPASTGWTSGSINLSSSNFIPLGGSIAATLANVTTIELNYMAGGSYLVSDSLIQFRLDNIQVVPEPSASMLLALGSLMVGLRARKN